MKIMLKISSIAFLVIGTLTIIFGIYIVIHWGVMGYNLEYTLDKSAQGIEDFFAMILGDDPSDSPPIERHMSVIDIIWGMMVVLDGIISLLIGLIGLIGRKKKSSMLGAGIILAYINAAPPVIMFLFTFISSFFFEIVSIRLAANVLFIISAINLRRREKEEINLLK